MKSSSKILIGGIIVGVILLFVGIRVAYFVYYVYRGWGELLIALSIICFLVTGIYATVKAQKEKSEKK